MTHCRLKDATKRFLVLFDGSRASPAQSRPIFSPFCRSIGSNMLTCQRPIRSHPFARTNANCFIAALTVRRSTDYRSPCRCIGRLPWHGSFITDSTAAGIAADPLVTIPEGVRNNRRAPHSEYWLLPLWHVSLWSSTKGSSLSMKRERRWSNERKVREPLFLHPMGFGRGPHGDLAILDGCQRPRVASGTPSPSQGLRFLTTQHLPIKRLRLACLLSSFTLVLNFLP